MERLWEESSTVTLHMPMHLYTESINDDTNCIALLYGPHVMAGCTEEAREAPTLRGPKDRPHDWLTPNDSDSFSFVHSAPQPIRFMPLSRVVDEDYHVYFGTR